MTFNITFNNSSTFMLVCDNINIIVPANADAQKPLRKGIPAYAGMTISIEFTYSKVC